MSNIEIIRPLGWYYVNKDLKVLILESDQDWITWCYDRPGGKGEKIHESLIRYEIDPITGKAKGYFKREDIKDGSKLFYINDFTWRNT